MPGWQIFYENNKNPDFEFLSIAMDLQGAEVAKPWWTKANATYPQLIDSENCIGIKYHIRAVPWGFLVNERGELVWGPAQLSPSKKELIDGIIEWIHKGGSARIVQSKKATIPSISSTNEEAEARLRLGAALYKKGDKSGALQEWRKALDLDPENWIIHKQIWAVEYPDKFYSGDVDFAWQKEMLKQGK